MAVSPPGEFKTPSGSCAATSDSDDSDTDPKDVVASPPGELKTPDGKRASTSPKTDAVTSSPGELRTPNGERVVTSPEKVAASKSVPQIEEEINKIRAESQTITTPQRHNIFIIDSYWKTVGTSAYNLKFSEEDLKNRLQMKSLFKSKDCRKAKELLESFNGRDMDVSYPKIGTPHR